MKRWLMFMVLATVLFPAGQALAQTSDRYDDDYDDGGRDRDRFALGVGIGLVEPLNDVENYYMASLRIRVNGRGDERGRSDEGISGYLEPEVGYWESGDERVSGSDLLVGVNLVGVVPLGPVDSFYGVGAGVHSIDSSLLKNDPRLSGSETKFGANAQFGIDLYITRKLSAFGTGRFDLVQGSEDRVQTKVYLGLRGRF